jgi:hypothetical protein
MILTKEIHNISIFTHKLKKETPLSQEEWTQAIKSIDNLIKKIAEIFIQTCAKPPPPPPLLTEKTKQQGGYLPKQLQKLWKKQLKIHHYTRKIIHLTQHDTNWRNHSKIINMALDLPKPPQVAMPITTWIQEMAKIGKEAK